MRREQNGRRCWTPNWPAGDGRLVVIEGEAGIGKTRLAAGARAGHARSVAPLGGHRLLLPRRAGVQALLNWAWGCVRFRLRGNLAGDSLRRGERYRPEESSGYRRLGLERDGPIERPTNWCTGRRTLPP